MSTRVAVILVIWAMSGDFNSGTSAQTPPSPDPKRQLPVVKEQVESYRDRRRANDVTQATAACS